ncbi:MAG: SprB repeat-containing protein, partial [Saprospiraceae bacterium]|nr:SprB repeat-containing protein [Saprospiraceae bacterium]
MRNLSFLPGRMSWLGFLTLVAISSVQVGGLHANTFENSNIHDLLTCDNVTDGGSIEGDEIGCPDPIFDPSEIINVVLPSGGSGDLEYVWMYTTVDPALPITLWQALPNSNSPSYDPGPITTTTWYRRCSRRSGCTEYTGETGYVTKEVKCCENVDNPGIIGSDQESCNTPFDPDVIVNISLPSGGSGNLVYAWYTSQTGPPFDPGTWSIIPGANQPTFDPGAVSTTTWYIRAARREDCSDFLYSNPVVMQILDGPVVSGVIQHVDCFGQSTGGINLSVTGGAPGYEYDWDNAPDVENPSNLVAGIYSVMVSDQNGCEATASFEVEQPPLLVLSGVVANPVCNGLATGSIDLTVAGGTPGYTYLWSTGATTPDLSGLNAGVYAVTVTDQNGCTQTGSYPINEPSALILSITKMDVSCAGAADGSIQLTVTGGTPGYTYLWSTGATTPDLSGLNAGVYAVTVTDQNGCTQTGSYPINEPSALILSITKMDVSCAGAADGSIQLTV